MLLFSYNTIVDSIFYGLGRTDLMLHQSLIVNLLFYGSIFVLFKMGIFIPTLDRIVIMFGISMTLDAIITFTMYIYLSKKDRLISNN